MRALEADPQALAEFVQRYAPTTTTTYEPDTEPPPDYDEAAAQPLHDRATRELPDRLKTFWVDGMIPDGYPSRSEACIAIVVTLAALGFSECEAFLACQHNAHVWQRCLDARKGREARAAALLWSDVRRGVKFETEHPRGPSKPEDFDDLPAGEVPSGEVKPSVTRKRSTRKLVHVRELADPTPIDWLVKSYIEHETLCILFGEPASGKSFIALDLAVAVARGADWNGKRTKQGGVVYVAGEGHKGIGRRLQAAALRHDFDLPALPMHVSRTAIPFTKADAVFALCDEILALELLEDLQLRLVIIDTLRRNFGSGDENSTKDMAAFIEACAYLQRTLRCTVLVAHHTGHGDKDRERGSSVITGDFDARYQIVKAQPLSLLRCLKLKDAPAPDPLSFALDTVDLGYTDEDGDPITSAVPVWHAAAANADRIAVFDRPRIPRSTATLLRVLTDMLGEDASSVQAPIDAQEQGATRAVQRTPLVEELIARGISRSDEKGSAMRVIRSTLHAATKVDKWVGCTDDGAYYWLTSAGLGALRDDDCPV